MLNVVAKTVFKHITSFEAHRNANGETNSKFIKLLLIRYVNLAVVTLIVNFKVDIDQGF